MGASAVGASAEVDCKGEAQTPGRLTDESQFDSTKRVLFDEDLLQLCMSTLHLPEVLCAAACRVAAAFDLSEIGDGHGWMLD